ncbi:MAG: hypothetical protein QOJ50_968, partial [Cryptosporangiaceae bacterium]|nr:hypothetical protein [Cryptosporangiaceae bacterium]
AAALAAATVAVFVPPSPGPDTATVPHLARSLQFRRRRAGSAIAGGS